MADSRSFTVWLWKNGAVSADSTTGGVLNSSNGSSTPQTATVQKFPNPPFGSGRTPKPPSRGRPRSCASCRSLTFVGAPMLKPSGVLSSFGNPGERELNDTADVPPALKWQALQFLWPGSPMLPVS